MIQVLTPLEATKKEKGDLLELLAAEFLKTQNYCVSSNVRVTASELDLLCEHRVNKRKIYVECKAHKDTLSASVLIKLLGTITFNNYSEGWLVSTGPLGKDAKGFLYEWEKKLSSERERLSIYTPEKIIEALHNANIICDEPITTASSLVEETGSSLGEWTLLITPWGKYWAAPVLKDGIPDAVIIFNAVSGSIITSSTLFEKFENTEFELKDLKHFNQGKKGNANKPDQSEAVVVEVVFGEKWFDYRPARPEHFVGRKAAQKTLLKFFTNVKKGRTETRIFSIKGDSGIGKSSLIAKMRDVAKTSKKPNKLFLYAVDMRAANDASYIHSSLLTALRKAALCGFGCKDKLEITNYYDPLLSKSIKHFLDECARKHELLILIFDQFEELYSKAELFAIFEKAKRLMFSTISASTNLTLGFAWKTDSTVPQDHPAYHMWHQLADHRYEILLNPFNRADAKNSLEVFEQELSESLLPELRKYLLECSRGYPWLLKKLCIHIYQQLQQGTNQHQLANRSLDISSLFDQDLNTLTDEEMGCLKTIAQNAPMDWYEVLENVDPGIVQSLQNKRLLIKSGNKLNLYWDIFRDYVLSGSVPTIPFTYIPQSPSLSAFVRVLTQLDDVEEKNIQDLANGSNLEKSTIRNIVHDLDEFGVIATSNNKITISNHFEKYDSETVLSNIRLIFKRHALTDKLRKYNSSLPASLEQIVTYLKEVNPTAQYHIRTWRTYGKRMIIWLQALGFLIRVREEVLFHDKGNISKDSTRKWAGERQRILFLGDTSPAKVIEALDVLKKSPKSQNSMKNLGFRNACAVLYRFRLIELTSTNAYRVTERTLECPSIDSVWNESGNEASIISVIDYLKSNPLSTPEAIGKHIADHFAREWKESSCKRVGNALRQWSQWHMKSTGSGTSVPPAPGRISVIEEQSSLFDCNDKKN